jgi:hypothetical protein
MPKTRSARSGLRRRSGVPAKRPAQSESRGLLARLLDVPQLAHVVPQLPPEIVHRIIQTYGLEDCGELVALATPRQLTRIFDLDLWRPARAGRDEQLDAERFGTWLGVLVEYGAGVAAEKLAGLDPDLVVTAFAQHVCVFDRAAVSPSIADGEEGPENRSLGARTSCEIGPYLVEAKRADSWDAIVELLLFAETERADFFHRLMAGCRDLSNGGYEVDGLDDLLARGEQEMFDVAIDRERRRDAQGYVAPGQARAFLQSARQLHLADATRPPASIIAGAYFRAVDHEPLADEGVNHLLMSLLPPAAPTQETARAMAAVMDLLAEGGVLQQPPRALIAGSQEQAPGLGLLQAHLQFAREAGDAVYASRIGEFAFLANTVRAGCSVQGRPFTEQEASDAVAAVCNLGLENWPAAWRRGTILADEFLVTQDLISVFQVGWTVLHDEVSMYAAGQLIDVLLDVQCGDREGQRDLDDLRLQLTRYLRAGTPWLAHDAMDAIMLLDMSAWAALRGLIAECPVIHGAMHSAPGSQVRSVSASSFEFISENRQIAAVRRFIESLPQALRA